MLLKVASKFLSITSGMVLSLSVMAFCHANAAKVGVDFYDEANFLTANQRHTPEQMAAVPKIAGQYFNILRTITDSNEGDPGQYICSCYRAGDLMVDPRQCAFQQAVSQHDNLQLVLTIENPDKWLTTRQKAISYLYQFVLPLEKGMTFPDNPDLQPHFWGTKPNTLAAAGCDFGTKHNHILAIVVGLEVGAHINPASPDFGHKIQQINQLDQYVTNLIDALSLFNLKQSIYVTTSIAPSNCDMSSSHCGNVLELLPLKNGHYAVNTNRYNVNGQEVDFNHVYQALKQIEQQQYSGQPLGVLLSLCHYWQYSPDQDFSKFDRSAWLAALKARYELIQSAIQQQPELSNLPVSIGEIGWPAFGDNHCDGAPNRPNALTQQTLLQAVHDWSVDDQSHQVPLILLWRLFEIDQYAANQLACGMRNPEVAYGLLPGDLRTLYLSSSVTPRAGDNFPDFKGPVAG